MKCEKLSGKRSKEEDAKVLKVLNDEHLSEDDYVVEEI
jgi:hypothetical protein